MNCMVTGVSRGIGRSIIAELMRQGHSIWGVSRTAVPDLLEEEQGRFRHSLCDVGNSESRRRTAEEMDAAGFWPDAVILNAAVGYEEEKAALSWEKMQEVLRINVEGALFWISHWMDRHPRRSMQFVGVSSLLALWPDANCPAYSTSKAALSMAFRAFRLRHAEDRIAFKLSVSGPHSNLDQSALCFKTTRQLERGEAGISGSIHRKHRSFQTVFSFYYPSTIGLVCRFGYWMPDSLF